MTDQFKTDVVIRPSASNPAVAELVVILPQREYVLATLRRELLDESPKLVNELGGAGMVWLLNRVAEFNAQAKPGSEVTLAAVVKLDGGP